jgi:hypothetical protein
MGEILEPTLWLPAVNAEDARDFSDTRWATLQTEETRRDPRTVTKRLASWSVGPAGAALKITPGIAKFLLGQERLLLAKDTILIAAGLMDPERRLDADSRSRSINEGGGGRGGNHGRP